MISRYYICDSCDHNLVVQQELHDETRLKKCPNCGKNKLYQDLTGQHSFVYKEPATLGHYASRKTERAGKYEIEAEHLRQKRAKEAPKLEKMKKAGLVPYNAEELPSQKSWINPEGENLVKKLSKIVNEPNKKVKKEKIKKYVREGKIT
jgi:putative FmdB family regulatory protein